MITDVVLVVLWVWCSFLLAFIVFFVTDPVADTRWRRRLIDVRSLQPVSKILLAQKMAFVAVVLFITVVRFTGGGEWREWVALGLYTLLALIAFAAFVDLRLLQLPQERRLRGRPEREYKP